MKGMLKIDDFLNINYLTGFKVDKFKRYGYYFLEKMNIQNNTYDRLLYRIDLSTKLYKELKHDFKVSEFDFYEDYLILKSVEDGYSKFYSFNDKTQHYELICTLPYEVSQFKFGKDKIYFVASINIPNESTIMSATNSPFFNEGHGKERKKEKLIFESDFSGKCVNVITPLDMDVDIVDFDISSNRILFTGKSVDSCKKASTYMFSYDTTTDTMDVLIEGGYRIDMICSISQNEIIFVGVDLLNKSRNDNQQVYKISTNDKCISTTNDYIDYSNEQTTVISDAYYVAGKTYGKSEEGFYHVRSGRNKQIVCTIDMSLNISFLETELKTISSIQSIGGVFYIIGSEGSSLSELYRYDSSNGLEKLTYHNIWITDYEQSVSTTHTYLIDGLEIDGYVYEPIGKNNEKSPGILMIHGGPKMMYSDIYSFDIQYLCSKGYYVFMCNPSGSDGRGDEFSNIRGTFANKPFNQLMSFTNEVLKSYPNIDENRLGVTGGSYGGYMTNHIIASTDKFKAAVSERGISNMITAITLSDIGNEYISEYLDIEDDPYGSMDILLANSPVIKVHNVVTPTLFNHGEDDRRCSYVESMQMQSALAQNGIETKLCIYKGENHSLAVKGKPASKLRRFEEVSAWFDKYLKERS